MRGSVVTTAFVTCDLLDDHPELDLQVVSPSMDGKFFRAMVRVKPLVVRW